MVIVLLYASLTTNGSFISIIFLTYYGMATSRPSRAQYLWCVCAGRRQGAGVLEHIFC